jgi:large exoprotein involved in heme utilization and adhesion
VGSTGVGDGGNIEVQANSILLNNGAQFRASTFGRGNAGNVRILGADSIVFDGMGSNGLPSGLLSSVEQGAIGNSGSIEVQADSILLSNGAQFRASTFGRGNAGNVRILGADSIVFDGIGSNGLPSGLLSSVEQGAKGKGGNIEVQADSISLSNGAQFRASTFGEGDAGNIRILGAGSIVLSGNDTGVISNVGPTGFGNGGNIEAAASSISLSNGAQVSVATFGRGNAGSIFFNSLNSVELIGTSPDGQFASGLRSAVEQGARGNAGNLTINTGRLVMRDGAQISAATRGLGNSGNLTVRAVDSVELVGTSANGRFASGLTSAIEFGGVGNGGNLNFETRRLQIRDGAQISTATFGQGNAGSINFNAEESVDIIGTSPDGQFASGLRSAVEQGARGNAGDLRFATGRLVVRDGAEVSVSNQGRGNAGNIRAKVQSIRLDNQGKLTANSVIGSEGNIFLSVQDLLLLRRNSEISAVSGTPQTGGEGGNFQIDANFIVAVPSENSDIITNAFTGSGGNIAIRSEGIFGSQFRQQQTPSSDIVASGTVTLNAPDVDQNLGLVELPTVLADTSDIVNTGCDAIASTADAQGSKFTITGRGGLPPNPDQPLSPDVVWSDTRLPNTTQRRSPKPITKSPSKSDIVEIHPATGWVFNGKGEVTLISHTPNSTYTESTAASCPQRWN